MSKRFDLRSYLEEKLDRFRPSAGSEVTGVCPFCGRYGGFYVNTDTGAYLCNKCGDFRGRRPAGLVAAIEDISEVEATGFIFRSSVEVRRRETMFTLRERLQSIRPHASPQERTLVTVVDDSLPGEFRPCYAVRGAKEVWQLPSYLKARRIKSGTAKAWDMGYVSSNCRHTRECEASEGDKCIAGCSWRYSGRLVIPVECPNGKSFTARDMMGSQIPKYLNPTGTDFRRLLIGWNTARLTGDIVLCEGPLDAVMLWQHSISALSLGGKELHDEQMSMLMSLPNTTAVTLMLDPDELEAPYKAALRLSVHFTAIYIAKLETIDGASKRGFDKYGKPSKLDPGNATYKEAYAAIDNAQRWTGARGGRLAAKLAKARQVGSSRWS